MAESVAYVLGIYVMHGLALGNCSATHRCSQTLLGLITAAIQFGTLQSTNTRSILTSIIHDCTPESRNILPRVRLAVNHSRFQTRRVRQQSNHRIMHMHGTQSNVTVTCTTIYIQNPQSIALFGELVSASVVVDFSTEFSTKKLRIRI